MGTARLIIRIKVVMFLMLCSYLINFMSWATTYYVDATNGNDDDDGQNPSTAWQTIKKINETGFQPGDQVLFKRGEIWREQLTIKSSGTPGNPIFFGCYGEDNKPIIEGSDINGIIQTEHCIYSDDQADYIIIDGFRLESCKDAAIFSSENDGWIIRNCIIENSGKRGIWGRGNPNGDGSAKDWIVEDNTIGVINCDNSGSNMKAAILLHGMYAPIIRRNKIASENTRGIILNSGDGVNSGAESTLAEIYENDITNSLSGIIACWTTHCKIYRNHIHNCRGLGIATPYGSHNPEIYYNVINDLSISPDGRLFNGIDINCDSQNGKVYNNIVRKVAYCSFTIETDVAPCNGWEIRNNIFDARENSPGDVPIQVYNDISDITISNNNYICNKTESYFRDKVGRWKGEYLALQEWNSRTVDSGSISSDPLWVDPENSDLRLSDDSPCIDAGMNVGLSRDFDGNPVFHGQGVDIGAFEYHTIYPPKNVRIIKL